MRLLAFDRRLVMSGLSVDERDPGSGATDPLLVAVVGLLDARDRRPRRDGDRRPQAQPAAGRRDHRAGPRAAAAPEQRPPPRPRPRPQLVARRWWRWPRGRDVERDGVPDVPHRVSRHGVLHARRAPARAARGDARRSAARADERQECGPRVHGVSPRVRAGPAQLPARRQRARAVSRSTTRRARAAAATRPSPPAWSRASVPVCGAKYDLNARFCGHDAGELVVIN